MGPGGRSPGGPRGRRHQGAARLGGPGDPGTGGAEAAEIKERVRREARAEQRRHSRQWAGHRNPEPEQERPGNASGGRGTGGARKTPPRGSNDPFTVLGVAPGADKAAIKTAYRCLAKGAHPDKNPGDPQAAERFRRIRKAYSEALKAAKD